MSGPGTGVTGGAAGPGGAPAGAADAAEVSVVVPYYRDQAGLDRLLAALAAQDHPASRIQAVVADDGSPEPPRIPAGLPFETVVVRQEDRGFRAAAARALGVEAAEGRVLAFLDGDMLPEPGYLRAACAAPAASGLAAVVGRRRHLDPRLLDDGAWRPGDEVPAWARLGDPAWLAEAYERTGDLARADATSYRFVISAVLTVAREVYEDAGGFDPAFVGYGGEDWELAHRLWRSGAVLRHEPAAVAWQAGADFGGRGDPAEARRMKNREAMVLAPRISAPTARGAALGLGGVGGGVIGGAGGGIVGRIPGQGAPRVGVTVRAGGCGGEDASVPRGSVTETTLLSGLSDVEGVVSVTDSGPGDACVVVGVDAALQAFPAARVRVLGALGDDAAACLADPRVDCGDGGIAAAETGPAASGEGADPRDALRRAPDWSVDVVRPVRPAGRGERPDPRAAAEWLLGLERDGVERVELTDGGDVGVVLTSVRGHWRAHRDPGVTLPTRRLDLADVGWAAVEPDPDLEGWWGGWA